MFLTSVLGFDTGKDVLFMYGEINLKYYKYVDHHLSPS